MRVLFCNVTWMKFYNGVNDFDSVSGSGGSYIKKYKTGAEIYNFQDYNGYCYGYVSAKGEIHIEKIEGGCNNISEIDNVLIVWTAKSASEVNNVIIGWYKNATVFRYEQVAESFPNVGRELYFRIKAKSTDCFLLPEDDRTFIIPRASEAGKGRGIGQSNYWFADSQYSKEELIPKVTEYIFNCSSSNINTVYTNKVLTKGLSEEELAADNIYDINDTDLINTIGREFLEGGDYYKALLYFNTVLKKKQNADFYYNRGLALRGLNCFENAIIAFEKVIEIEGKMEDNLGTLMYLYEITNQNEKSLEICEDLIKIIDPENIEVICEVYSAMTDTYLRMGKIQDAINSIDYIINNARDKELKKYSVEVKNNLIERM